MCKIAGITASMRKVSFEKRGYISVYLDDGRIVTAPLRMFPDIRKLSPAQREKWTILDGQYLAFFGVSEIYSIVDFMTLTPPEGGIKGG